MVKRMALTALLVAVATVLGGIGWLSCSRPTFRPEQVARSETRMWRSYYSENRRELGLELVRLLRAQYGLKAIEAKRVAESFAAAAMAFRPARGEYEAKVLPDLTRAYAGIRQAKGSTFDPEAAARAELAWWVARRTAGQNAPEDVGMKIGQLYAVLHGSDHPAFRKAGILRAQAAHLRDVGGKQADWVRIETLLHESYAALEEAL